MDAFPNLLLDIPPVADCWRICPRSRAGFWHHDVDQHLRMTRVLGGGEVDLKMRVSYDALISKFDAVAVDCTYDE